MDSTLLKQLTETFLEKLGVGFDSVSVSHEYRTVVAVSSNDSKTLIGPHGEHLQALNSILRRMVEKQYGEEASSFLVDVNGYHEERMEKVRQNARILAQRARLFKHDVEMDPMSSYERLVVHELFARDPEIKTESAGEGKFRHIILKYSSGSPATL